MKKIIISWFLFSVVVLSACIETPLYTNEVIYDCANGDYSFPESEPIFKSISVSLIDFNGLKDNECLLSLNYKIKFKPTDNLYYEVDFDTCKLTVSQLSYFKEKNADITTILKDATCDQNTNQFLDKAIKPLDFKGQEREIIGEFSTSTTEFTYSFEDWVNGVITYESFIEVLKNEKNNSEQSIQRFKGFTAEARRGRNTNKSL